MEIIAQHETIFYILALLFGLYMTWGIGANDVANAMGTSVGSGAITVKQAIVIAAIMEFAGAYLAGGAVTSTISKGIIDGKLFEPHPQLLLFGMLGALLAAGIWLMVATMRGWPVSTTHSIVGAVVGVGVAVKWDKLGEIVASWFVSPVLGGVIALLLMLSIRKLILNTDEPIQQARKWGPAYGFLVGWVVSLVTLTKGLKHVGLHFSVLENLGISFVSGIVVALIGAALLTRIKPDPDADKDFRFTSVERIFAVLMIFTACAMAFAHGSNDVANAVGPVAAIYGVMQNTGAVIAKSQMPHWVLLIGAIGIVAGLATLGARVMATVGQRITELTPSRGFAAELGAATTVVLASGIGMPISTTHTLVGAVLGVGMARGIGSLNLRVIGTIFTSWVVTLPAGALLAILFFYFFKGLFGA